MPVQNVHIPLQAQCAASSNVFAAVLALGTLPHLPKPELTTAEMVHVAKPGAIIGAEVPQVTRPKRSWKARVKYAIQRMEQIVRRSPNPADPRLHWNWSVRRLWDLVAPFADINGPAQVSEECLLLVGQVR